MIDKDGRLTPPTETRLCPSCNGRGKFTYGFVHQTSTPCIKCSGTGKVPSDAELQREEAQPSVQDLMHPKSR